MPKCPVLDTVNKYDFLTLSLPLRSYAFMLMPSNLNLCSNTLTTIAFYSALFAQSDGGKGGGRSHGNTHESQKDAV